MPNPPRVALCCLPTPLHRLDRLSAELGIDLWIKRDDLTGFAGGGNKGRKLEYLLPDILTKKPDVVVCSGASQSNFVRQLGAACAMYGIRCHAVVMECPYATETGPIDAPQWKGGNLPLDELFGIEIEQVPDGTWDQLDEAASHAALRLESDGLRVETVKLGGSSPQGIYAFSQAFLEVTDHGFDWIVVPCSSGSTFVGLVIGAMRCKTKVVGIGCDAEPDMIDDLVDLWDQAHRAGLAPPADSSRINLRLNWAGPAYGIPTTESSTAMARFARTEGIILDPVYTAKAFAGLIELVEKKEIKGKVLFWHTGGVPLSSADLL